MKCECPCAEICKQIKGLRGDFKPPWHIIFQNAVIAISQTTETFNQATKCAEANPSSCALSVRNPGVPMHPFRTRGILATAADIRIASGFDEVFGEGNSGEKY